MTTFGGKRTLCAEQLSAASAALAASDRVDDACKLAVAGKLALREIARWVEGLAISEAEFRLMWLLQWPHERAMQENSVIDQRELATRLSVSQAQVSGIVQRLQQSGYIESLNDRDDRRRQLWRLAGPGEMLIQRVLERVREAPLETTVGALPQASPLKDEGWEEAA
jgi:DNA-binding MarR family transcriptional regulator